MRVRFPGQLLLAIFIGAASAGAGPDLEIPADLRADFDALDAPLDDTGRAGALPAPSLTEPFEIGEALADSARVDLGIVSLLARMQMPLPDSLVRGLIDMGREDLLAAASKGGAPYTFRHLHAAVQPLLPDLDVGRLAAMYAQAYDSAPDSLVPQVLQGMPIEPDTPLTRPQLWLLLVDGFAPPAATTRLAQLHPQRLAQSGGAAWGTASLFVPPLPSPDPLLDVRDWNYLVSILPMAAWGIPFDIVPDFGSAHEGHGGNGSPVTLEAQIGFRPAALVSPFSGQPVLRIKPPDRGNRMVWWRMRELSRLQRHGNLDAQPGMPLQTDAMGAARLTFTPKREAADGHGEETSEMVAWDASINQWDLLSSNYDISPLLRGFANGNRMAFGFLDVAWHTDKWIRVSLTNRYHAVLDLGFLAKGHRVGKDRASGMLVWDDDDGRYAGDFEADARATQRIDSPLSNCPKARSAGRQILHVKAREVAGFNSQVQSIVGMPASPPVAGHLALEFTPATWPRMSATDRCQNLIYRDPEPVPFIPLNDSRWPLANGGYVIAYPESGSLAYSDYTITQPMRSSWEVRVERPTAAP